MLHINGLTHRIDGRPLFDRATCAIAKGWRVALIGRNGSGKSTLMRLIADQTPPDHGTINRRPGITVGYLSQTAPNGADSLIDVVLAADHERTQLLTALSTETDPHTIANMQTRLADIGAHAAPARAATILHGLGFPTPVQSQMLNTLSGGWRMRVGLAQVLFSAPDVMLLDEPTNHLDLEATVWLTSFLARWQGTLLIVSHDRNLINAVATHTVHLENGKLATTPGGFDEFERIYQEKQILAQKSYEKEQAYREHLQSYVDRFRYKATKARQAQSRLKMLQRLQAAPPRPRPAATDIIFPEPEPLPPPVITLEDAAVGYGEHAPVLHDLNLRIDLDDRIGLLGANGNGKTTLARLLAGRLDVTRGSCVRTPKLRVGYFSQDQFDTLAPTNTPMTQIAPLMPGADVTAIRAYLGRFAISAEHADTEIAHLSGGERARLLLAVMCHARPQLLILDEPTNHLDLVMRQALIDAINDFAGGIVLITHDRSLLELCTERLWLVADGRCRPYDGDLEDYSRLTLKRRRNDDGTGRRTAADGRPSKKEMRRASAQDRARTVALRRAVTDAEREIETLTRQRDILDAKLADPGLYNGRADEISALNQQRVAIMAALTRAEDAWLVAQDALDTDGR